MITVEKETFDPSLCNCRIVLGSFAGFRGRVTEETEHCIQVQTPEGLFVYTGKENVVKVANHLQEG